jgi:hypothetical protein
MTSELVVERPAAPAAPSLDIDAAAERPAESLAATATQRDHAGGHAAEQPELIRESGLLVAPASLTRVIAGTSIGPVATALPLSFTAVQQFARLVEQNLREVSRRVIEAVRAMGASELQRCCACCWLRPARAWS